MYAKCRDVPIVFKKKVNLVQLMLDKSHIKRPPKRKPKPAPRPQSAPALSSPRTEAYRIFQKEKKDRIANENASDFKKLPYAQHKLGMQRWEMAKMVGEGGTEEAITKAEMNAADEPTATVGCGSCDLVPCGRCQEGCPVSACEYEGAPDKLDKTDRNGCYPQNGDATGPWPNVKKVAVNGGFKTDFKPGITNYKQMPKECRVATTAAPKTTTAEPATTARRRVDLI